jgi:hypothetical protein
MFKGNTVNTSKDVIGRSSVCLTSRYAGEEWAHDADHWIHTARHEAGHAVALVSLYKKFGKRSAPFERILIRPGATRPYVTSYGRQSDCLGCVERGAEILPMLAKGRDLQAGDAHSKRETAINLQIKILADLCGPMAEMRSWNDAADLDSDEYRWTRADNADEIRCAARYFEDLRALTGDGVTLRALEEQSYRLVKQEWTAVVVLAEELMHRHCLEYSEAVQVIAPLLALAA